MTDETVGFEKKKKKKKNLTELVDLKTRKLNW